MVTAPHLGDGSFAKPEMLARKEYEGSPNQSICVFVCTERVDLVAENIIGARRALDVVAV
jgi:hypothetical protein